MTRKCLAFVLSLSLIGSTLTTKNSMEAFTCEKIKNKYSNRIDNIDSKKLKEVSKKVAIAPVKAGWWFIKNNLKAAGILLLDLTII